MLRQAPLPIYAYTSHDKQGQHDCTPSGHCFGFRANFPRRVAELAEALRQTGWSHQSRQPGRALGAICYPENPTPLETNAAAELRYWIKEITGTALEIKSGKPAKGSVSIRTDRSLGDEGYGITVERGGIVLSGGKARGVFNAVFALLEEDLGCRFYANDSIRLPRTNTLVIAPVARRYRPQLKIRDPFYASAFDPVWSLRNRSNAPNAPVPEGQGGHMDYGGMFVHTAAQMVPPDKYFKEHPDYFAQQADGTRTAAQLCATHPDVVKICIEHVRNVLKNNPHTEILSVSKNDVQLSCLCERCKKLRDAEGSDMANQLFLVNQVAEAIEPDYPEVTIDTLAYLETIQVPKTVRPRQKRGDPAVQRFGGGVVKTVHARREVRRGQAGTCLGGGAQPHLHLGLHRQFQPLSRPHAEPGRHGGQYPLLDQATGPKA